MTDREAPARVLLVADFTVSGLAPYLEGGDAPALSTVVAPFDQVVPVLLDGTAECWQSKPDAAFVWTRPQSAIRSFSRVLAHEPVPVDDLLAEVDEFCESLRAAASRVASLFVASWTQPPHDRGLGILNLDPTAGPAYLLARMNLRLVETLSGDRNVRVLDAARWVARAGEAGTNPKLWHLGKIAFGPDVLRHAAGDLRAAMSAARGLARKLVVVDLDETLWGGVVGDVGWQDLRLGGHDPIGEAFVAFQHGLKRLTRRGVVLAIASKNTEAIALEAIDRHPEMVLRRDDFVAWRINWNDKADHVADLAAELNLGLDSVVFIDDNPAERARVKGALPQVLVPEWPVDKLLYEQALAELTCFDTMSLSAEDQARTRMYVSERERTVAKRSAQSMDDYLASLGLIVAVDRLGTASLARATQLLNKTNQMNLSTRRLTETQLAEWSADPNRQTFVFRVSDRFDDYGLTGIGSLEVSGPTARIVDFVLSCRVLGRGVEETMLSTLIDVARTAGALELVVPYSPTPKNGPCRIFLADRSGLHRGPDDATFVWPVGDRYPPPGHVTCQLATSAPAT